MKVLLVAATEFEIAPFLKSKVFQKSAIDTLVSGIGMTFTTFSLTQQLRDKSYDVVINAGIAGSFSKELSIGNVVQVIQEEFADLAYETPQGYHTFFESAMLDENVYPFENGKLHSNPRLPFEKNLKTLQKVNGITVNKVHGKSDSIEIVREKFNADVESMEGAAVFYVCKQMNIPVVQIRSISNYVEPRNKDKWNIPLAIKKLNAFLEVFFSN